MEQAEVDRLVMKPTARRRLGKYVLLGRIGHGGMGKIYLAYAPGPAGIEKLLVVKRLHSHLTSDPVLVSSFLDEARLSMALNHPNIVSTFDVGDVDGRYFMVMEYIDGQNLGVVLRTAKRSNQYPSSAVWGGLFLSVLDGLHAAHNAKDARGRALQIIHRDVSPQNVLVTYEGLPKLVDFGIAKAAMRVSETDAGVLKGKYAYMSPEQVKGEPLDARSDVFAAGIVLWEMLAGRRLYKADSVVRSVERILTEPPISPVRVNSECDPEVAKIAFRALQKDKDKRFGSALEMKEALEDVLRAKNVRVRQSDVKDIMHRLFGDVIERQRAVLEMCLNESETASAAGDDDDVEPRASDSESDLLLNDLKHETGNSEATTPSALKRSPLVTQENEPAGLSALPPAPPAPSKTNLQRRRTGVESPAPAPAPISMAKAPLPLVPTLSVPPPEPPVITADAPAEPSEPTKSEMAPIAPAADLPSKTDAPVVDEGKTVENSATHTTRRPVVPIAAALAVLVVAGAGVGVVVRVGSDTTTITTTTPPPPPPPPTTPPPPPTTTTTTPPSTTTPSSTPQAPTAPIDAPRTVEEAKPPVEETSEPVVANGDKRKKKGRGTPPAAAPTGPREDMPDTRPDKPVVVADKAPAPDDAAEQTGTLTLETIPWTTVYLGKKKLGDTPLVGVAVPSGTLELTLVNAEANIKEGYVARVKPGQLYKARLDLR